MSGGVGAPLGAGGRAFQRLGRSVVRHPLRPIALWVVLLLLALPLLLRIGDATQNSASNVPSSAPSSQAAAELARLFPGSSTPSSSILLFTGANITGPSGQAAVIAATSRLANDSRLTDIASISSLYTGYAALLAGQTQLALGVFQAPGTSLAAQLAESQNLSTLLWGPPASFYAEWSANLTAHPGTPAAGWNYPVFRSVNASLPAGGPAQSVLQEFYDGVAGLAPGFNGSSASNGSGDCAAAGANASGCVDATARATGGAALLRVLPADEATFGVPLGRALLAVASIGNYSNATTVRAATADAFASGSGLPYRWIQLVWTEFPNGTAVPGAVGAWTTAVADGPVAEYPLPIPRSLYAGFVSRDDAATLVFVAFTVDDSTTTATGANPVFNDVAEIDRVVPDAVLAAAPGGSVGYAQTGPAALDADENTVLAQNLAIVLPLTILILVIITVLYFRSPLAPAVTFGALGIAIGLGLASLVLVAELFGKVDPTAITLENTFVLGVGTDYSIFLVARYREELRKGASSDDAIVTSVTWAGQSIATSGGTAVIATLALAFSGVGLLSQWGETLSIAVAITVLVALTVVPALLKLLGPRVFWPETGAKATRAAAEGERRIAEGRTYFHRAGRAAQTHPLLIVGLILLVSAPLAYVAITAPLSYDFYQQLPTRPGATQGLVDLGRHFGAGDAFPMTILATFPAPLVANGSVNATEFGDLEGLTEAVNATSGVASVTSPVGPYGASLPQWLGYAEAPVAVHAELAGLLTEYVGDDGATVVLTVIPEASGLSTAAVQLLGTLRSTVTSTLAEDGATGVRVAYGGGAAVTSDLAAQTATATDRMILAVMAGLVIVLFVVLRSWLIPPMAVGTILLSIAWAWGATQLLFVQGLGLSLFFFVPTVLFILILGLGIDYNIFLLTRVREERLRGRSSQEAVLEAVTRTGGIITAAAIILGGAFATLSAGDFVLLKAIGFSVAAAVILDAMVVRTYLVPASLQLLGERVWRLRGPPAAPSGPLGPDRSEPPP